MQVNRQAGIGSLNDQSKPIMKNRSLQSLKIFDLAQSQSVGLVPMPRSGSRLDPINENNNEVGGANNEKGAGGGLPTNTALPNGSNTTQNYNKNVSSNLPSGRGGLVGRGGLGGVGGSIISSSGIN